MFNTNLIRTDTMLDDIQRGELALPEFQRDFVWRAEKTAALLTSMIQKYPAGSFLLWSPSKPEIAARAFAGAPVLYSENPRLVLDGQQRLTSLYQAFFGTGKHRYYLNLKAFLGIDPNLDDAVTYEIAGGKSPNGLARDRREFRELLFPLERLRSGFQGFNTWCYERQRHPLTADDEGRGSEFDFRLTTIGNDWVRSLTDYQFPVVELTKNANINAVCHIFEKVNSTGQELSLFELLTARFWVKGINLRDLWRAAENTHAGILKAFNVEPVEILRVIALLAEVSDPGKPAALFNLSAEHIDRFWADAVRGFAWALELVREEFGVVDAQWLPYAPMLIPLAAIEARRPEGARPEQGGRLQRLHRWYWCSVFSGSYSQGAARQSVADFYALRRWLDDPINQLPPEAVETFPGFWPGRLRELSRKGQADYKACIGIILRRKPHDLASGAELITAQFPADQLQQRYIFSKRVLQAQNIPRALQDSILNRTMTRTRMTRHDTILRPSGYLKNAQRTLGARLPEVLKEHLLPDQPNSALWQDQFDRFLQERAQLFADEIAKLTGVPCRMSDHSGTLPRDATTILASEAPT